MVNEADFGKKLLPLLHGDSQAFADRLLGHRRMGSECDHDIQRRSLTRKLAVNLTEHYVQRAAARRVRHDQQDPFATEFIRGAAACYDF